MAAVLVLLWFKFRRARNLVVFARAGFFAALMVVAMSFHVAPLEYHLNPAALAGIVAGPAAALLARADLAEYNLATYQEEYPVRE